MECLRKRNSRNDQFAVAITLHMSDGYSFDRHAFDVELQLQCPDGGLERRGKITLSKTP